MALPSTGQLSFSAIATELGVSTPYSLRSMSSLAGKSTPDSVGEFYGYSAAPATVTLNIYISIDNLSSYGYQGNNNSWQIYDAVTSDEMFYYEYHDEYSGVYTASVTLQIGHTYNFSGYMGNISEIFNEFVFEPNNGFTGSPIYTLNELCYYWQDYGYSQAYGNFTINAGGDMDMYANATILDAGTSIDQCYYS
jgi:hypothetical protein